ncbi:MAG: antitoxin Xre/MbcA/ParS toxin-binding domain-containing protein [Ginsengibacter sp.]
MAQKPKSAPKKYPVTDDDLTMVEEPLAIYKSNNINLAILSGAAGKSESQMTSFEKMKVIKNGVSKKDLELLKNKAALDYSMLAKALSVTRATLINKKRDQKFNMALSEKIVSLADLYSFGFEIFGDKDLFNQWMRNPNRALGGQVPYDLIDNQYGREEIKNLIGRIAYGVYS